MTITPNVLRYHEGELSLSIGRHLIGRGPLCDVRLDDDLVSRRHAALYVTDTIVQVQDLGSRNGVYINGRRTVGMVNLSSGDTLKIGAQELALVERASELITGPEGLLTRPMQRYVEEVSVPDEGFENLKALSPREREVFDLLTQGFTHREIADQIGVSVKSVETYKSRVSSKLGLRTRAELIRFALDAGLLGAVP